VVAAAEHASKLLLRDKEELDRVAHRLGHGRSVFAIIACEDALRPEALAYLREKDAKKGIPDPVPLEDPEEALRLLIKGTSAPTTSVRSLSVRESNRDVQRTLNWHREKLRRGASVLLWVDGPIGLAAMREAAPDAYAFRDVVAMVRGVPPVPVLGPRVEPPQLREARNRLQRSETLPDRAGDTLVVIRFLRKIDEPGDAELIAHRLLATLNRADRDGQELGEIRIWTYLELAILSFIRGARIEQLHLTKAGLVELDERHSPQAQEQKLWLLSVMPGPLGKDLRSCSLALEEVRRSAVDPSLHSQVLRSLSFLYEQLGNLLQSSRLLEEAPAPHYLPPYGRARIALNKAELEISAGRLLAGDEQLRATASLFLQADASACETALSLARSLRLQGEIDVAHELLSAIRLQVGPKHPLWANISVELGRFSVDRGDIVIGLDRIRRAISDTIEQGRDGSHLASCTVLVESICCAHKTGVIGPEDINNAIIEMASAEAISRAMVGTYPIWYVILFSTLHSELLAIHPHSDGLFKAISITATTLARARAACVELAPQVARLHMSYLIRAERYVEALASVSHAVSDAHREGNLRELASLQRLAVVALVRSGRDEPEILAQLTALRETLESTGSLRIKADELLELGRALPPETTSPDPIALLEEAHALYLDMPIPGQEARSLEAMGDVLLARGKPAEAKRRFLAARRRYERYGLGLRLPLLASKLDRLQTP
jgi:tetratricopeptide (TPR) repeat protein